MSKRMLIFGVVVLLLLAAVGGFAQSIAWRADLGSAIAEAKRTGRMMMVDVYTDWCGWCKKLDSDTYTDAKVIALSAGFIALKLNPEESADGARFISTYGVNGYPTILFVEADGTLENRVVGYLDAPSFSDAMAKTTRDAPKIRAYLAEFKSGKYANAQELLSMLVELGRTTDARAVFDTLRAAKSLAPSFQESIALAIAQSFLDDDRYDDALSYLKIVEDFDSRSDNSRDAYLMHSIVIFYAHGKTAGMDYLDGLLQSPKTPAAWKSHFRDLRDQMKAAKDPARS